MNPASLAARVARLGVAAATVALPFAARVTPAGAAVLDANVHRLPFEIIQGKPDFDPGEGMGYWLWRDDDGLHLRTTTRGHEHDFNGVLRATGDGTFVDVDRVRLEHQGSNQDRVEVSPDHDTIRFHFDTWDGTDGFDFRLDGRVFCVELENNGQEAASATHLGQFQVQPDAMPVCFSRTER